MATKKFIAPLSACLTLTYAVIAGCGNNQRSGEESPLFTLESIGINTDIAQANGSGERQKNQTPPAKSPGADRSARPDGSSGAARENVDVDLTALNKMMMFAQIQNMMARPENFLGKTVRIGGIYDVWCYSADTEECHHFVTVDDVAACCKSGIEFQLKPGSGEYPKGPKHVEVSGVFSQYEKFGQTLYYLACDGITVLRR